MYISTINLVSFYDFFFFVFLIFVCFFFFLVCSFFVFFFCMFFFQKRYMYSNYLLFIFYFFFFKVWQSHHSRVLKKYGFYLGEKVLIQKCFRELEFGFWYDGFLRSWVAFDKYISVLLNPTGYNLSLCYYYIFSFSFAQGFVDGNVPDIIWSGKKDLRCNDVLGRSRHETTPNGKTFSP